MADPKLTLPIHLPRLNKAIAERVLSIDGDTFIKISRAGDAVTISLNLGALIPRLPNPVGIFKLVASATKPGMYTAHPLKRTGSPDHTSSSQLADTDFGAADTNVTVYLINVREVAVPSHALSTSSTPDIFIGFYCGLEADGKPIYAIDECQ